jgi:2-dehydropantoate 2-reductase
MNLESAKIAVVGSGAIGGYYGGKLALAGHDVHFLMRSDLKTVRKNGLVLREGDREMRLAQVQAFGSTEEIGPSDVVLIAIKTTGNAALDQLIPPLLHERTALVTLQNGLGNEEYLAERFGGDRVLGGLCFVCLNRVQHGVVEHYGHGTLPIGDFSKGSTGRPQALAAAFQRSGIDARAVEDLATERWRKLVWNIPFNGLSIAAGGVTVSDVLADEWLRTLARGLMDEVIRAANALGHSIPADFADFQIQRSLSMGPYKPSSLVDYLNAQVVEVESIWGEPLRRARKAGLDPGRLEALYLLLKKLTSRGGS